MELIELQMFDEVGSNDFIFKELLKVKVREFPNSVI